MGKLSKPATQGNTSLYILTAAPSTAVTSLSTFKAATAFDVAKSDHRLPLVTDVGDVEQTANTQDISVWGESTISIALPATFSPMRLAFVRDYSSTLQDSIRALGTGSSVWLGLYSKDGADEAALYIEGTLASNGLANATDGRRVAISIAIRSAREYA